MSDGFLSPGSNLLLISGLCLVFLAGFAALSSTGMAHGASAHFSAGSLGFIVTLLCTLQIQLFTTQQGLADASTARFEPWTLLLAVAMAGLIALVTAVAAEPVPKPPEQRSRHSSTVVDIKIPGHGTAVRTITSTMHPGIQLQLLMTIAITLGMAFIANEWSMYAIITLTTLLVIGCWSWQLRVDSRGFSYRSQLGFPRGLIFHDQIRQAEPVQISAWDWGGWGWCKNGSGTGLITRSGEGTRITQIDGKVLEASSRDAATAAALLKHFN